jgi:hypothetical protein
MPCRGYLAIKRPCQFCVRILDGVSRDGRAKPLRSRKATAQLKSSVSSAVSWSSRPSSLVFMLPRYAMTVSSSRSEVLCKDELITPVLGTPE